MRHRVKESPILILADDASGTLREDAKLRNQSRGGRARRLAASSIAVTLVATALIVTYFRADEDRYLEQVEQRLKKSDALLQEAKAAQAMTANAETKDRYLEQVEQEQKKTTALMQEAKAAQAMTANAEPQRRALEEAQARAAALASELDGATKQKQAAEAIALELQKSLQQERE